MLNQEEKLFSYNLISSFNETSNGKRTKWKAEDKLVYIGNFVIYQSLYLLFRAQNDFSNIISKARIADRIEEREAENWFRPLAFEFIISIFPHRRN